LVNLVSKREQYTFVDDFVFSSFPTQPKKKVMKN